MVVRWQFVCDRLPVPVTCTHDMLFFRASLYNRGCVAASAAVRTPLTTSFKEYRVNDDLERLIAAMARHQAHHQHRSLAAATRQIRDLVAEARAEYRAAGAPYGDDDQGFCRWLLARPRLTLAA